MNEMRLEDSAINAEEVKNRAFYAIRRNPVESIAVPKSRETMDERRAWSYAQGYSAVGFNVRVGEWIAYN